MEEKKEKTLIAVVGPTASGKTELAVQLAKKYDGEVVSADSMQIYIGMDIASAKPTKEEMDGVPHHLIDFLDPYETFSVSDYVKLAARAIDKIIAKGKQPIICGGTGLYIRSLINNISFSDEEKNEELRRELEEKYDEQGGEAMLRELSGFDPESAARLHPSDKKRIVRAVEIYRSTGICMTEHIRRSKLVPSPYRVTAIGLTFADRQKLYERINLRVDRMLEMGLLEEAKKFYADEKGHTASAAIGYKELRPYLEGRISLEAAVEKLKMETRRFAKRQMTWFRSDNYIHWIEVDNCDDLLAEAERIIQNGGAPWTNPL